MPSGNTSVVLDSRLVSSRVVFSDDPNKRRAQSLDCFVYVSVNCCLTLRGSGRDCSLGYYSCGLMSYVHCPNYCEQVSICIPTFWVLCDVRVSDRAGGRRFGIQHHQYADDLMLYCVTARRPVATSALFRRRLAMVPSECALLVNPGSG